MPHLGGRPVNNFSTSMSGSAAGGCHPVTGYLGRVAVMPDVAVRGVIFLDVDGLAPRASCGPFVG
jgi:hypothetical protein